MKTKIRRLACKALYFLAWPAHYFYLNHGAERSRVLMVHGDEVFVSVNWVSDGRWSLPGGGLHKGEPLLEGTLRELKEETGLSPNPDQLRFLCSDECRSYGLRFKFHCYVWECAKKLPTTRQQLEVAAQQWINYRELNPHNTGPDALIPVRAWFDKAEVLQ